MASRTVGYPSRWQARVQWKGKSYWLGEYRTEDQATLAEIEFKIDKLQEEANQLREKVDSGV